MSPKASELIWARLRVAGLLAGAAFLSAAPYVHFLGTDLVAERLAARFPGVSMGEAVHVDLRLMAVLVVMSALAGTFFSARYRLGGVGGLTEIVVARRWVAGGAVAAVAWALLLAPSLRAALPGYLPETFPRALAHLAKGVVFEEVVARFGLMTVVAGAVPRAWMANVVQAVFFTAVGIEGLAFFGFGPSPVFGASIAFSFALHLVLGGVYARYGLLAAMAVHAAVDVRFLFLPLLG